MKPAQAQKTQAALLARLGRLERIAVTFRVGEVTDTDPLSVKLGGSTVPYTGIKSVAPVAVGDRVAVLMLANDLLVIGRIASAGLHKTPLTFVSGWANHGAGTIEDATVSLSGRTVSVQGAVSKTGGTPTAGEVIAVLPAECWPEGSLYFPTASGPSANTFGSVAVLPNGEIWWLSGSTTETDFTSLSAIRFEID